MDLVSGFSRTIARKVPVFLHLNYQSVAIFLILLIVRFRTLHVQFYAFFILDLLTMLIKCKTAVRQRRLTRTLVRDVLPHIKIILFAVILPLSVNAQRPNVRHPVHKQHMTAELAIDTILRLPEIKENDAYIRRVTTGKRHLFGMIYGEPDSLNPYYWVVIGEDNGMSFVTHFTFYVYSNGRKILYHDNFSDSTTDLRNWRRKYHVRKSYRF